MAVVAVVAANLCFSWVNPHSLAVVDTVELFVAMAMSLPGRWSGN